MKNIKECTNWLMDNTDQELLGQRSGNKIHFDGSGFYITYGDESGSEELTNFNVFPSEDWSPASQTFATWKQARFWMESKEGSNQAENNGMQYVIINNQLRKVDIMEGDSYTVNFWVDLTDDGWKICY